MTRLLEGRHSLADALTEYDAAWQEFIKEYHLQKWAKLLSPSTISWKVAGKEALFENLEALAPETEQVHIGTVNGRFIASVLLSRPVRDGIKIVKILERRAGSSDLLGLDSIDFMVKDLQQTYQTLQKAGASVIEESNDMHDWLSLRFGGQKYEAKLVDHVVLEVAVKELRAAIKDLENC